MVNEVQYTSIKRVLDNLLEHPMLKDTSLEQAVRYTIRFIGLHGYPTLFQDKIDDVDIESFRGVLPCDLISIIQVKDLSTGICLRSMTDNFPIGMVDKGSKPFCSNYHRGSAKGEITKDDKHRILSDGSKGATCKDLYIPPAHRYPEEPAYKTQGRVIYVTFPEGKVAVSYKSIPVDEDGFPLLIDDETYLAALEAFIKLQVFTIKFDMGDLPQNVFQHTQQMYALRAGELQSAFTIPSVSEFESISRNLTSMIPRMREFDNGFKNLGNREYLKIH